MPLTQVQGGMLAGSTNTTTTIQSNGTTAITIDSSQNVGIGTTSPNSSAKLTLADAGGSGAVARVQFNSANAGVTNGTKIGFTAAGFQPDFEIWNGDAGIVRMATSNTERARITSAGDFLLGTTNSTVSGGVGYKYVADANNPYIGIVNTASTNGNNNYHLYSTGAGAFRFYVGLGGTVFATSTTISGISDVRLKENIKDLDDGLDAVMALKPRKFDWKEGKGKDVKGDRGFIAQEFEQVFPDMIDEWLDPAPEGEEPYKAVNANLIPTLVKAIQELKAELDATKAEVAALKATP